MPLLAASTHGFDVAEIGALFSAMALTSLLGSRISCGLTVEPPSAQGGSPYVRLTLDCLTGIGDSARAHKYEELLLTLGAAASLWTRKEPLCEHEIARFDKLAARYAARLYSQWDPSPA